MGEPGTALWNELSSSDPAKARAFYAAVLGWTYDDMPMPEGTYTICKAGETMAGGLMALPQPEMPSMWVPYFHVADVDETARTVEAEGGRIVAPAIDVENVGRMVWVADPTGAIVAFMTPVPQPAG